MVRTAEQRRQIEAAGLLTVMDVVESAGVYGLKTESIRDGREKVSHPEWDMLGTGVHVEWDREAWAAEASMKVHPLYDGDTDQCVFTVVVNWPTTKREPSAAIAFLALAREVAELGCLIESLALSAELMLSRGRQADPVSGGKR